MTRPVAPVPPKRAIELFTSAMRTAVAEEHYLGDRAFRPKAPIEVDHDGKTWQVATIPDQSRVLYATTTRRHGERLIMGYPSDEWLRDVLDPASRLSTPYTHAPDVKVPINPMVLRLADGARAAIVRTSANELFAVPLRGKTLYGIPQVDSPFA